MLFLRLAGQHTVFPRKARGRAVLPSPCLTVASQIYVAAKGELVALDRVTLEIVWRMRVPIEDVWPVGMASDDLLFVGGTEDVGVIDLRTRTLVWTRPGWLFRRVWRRQILLGVDGGLDVVAPQSGDVIESIHIAPGEAEGTVMAGDRLLYRLAGSNGHLGCYDLESRRVLWKRDLASELRQAYGIQDPEPFNMTPASESRFLGVSASGNGFVLGMSMDDGRVLWKADVSVPYYVPLVMDGRIPILTYDRFIVLDEETGDVQCDIKHGLLVYHQRRGGAIFGRVVFTAESGHVVLFDLSGVLLWQDRFETMLFDANVIDDRLLVMAADGQLWVFEGTDKPELKKSRRHAP